jgi:hypothetical protein
VHGIHVSRALRPVPGQASASYYTLPPPPSALSAPVNPLRSVSGCPDTSTKDAKPGGLPSEWTDSCKAQWNGVMHFRDMAGPYVGGAPDSVNALYTVTLWFRMFPPQPNGYKQSEGRRALRAALCCTLRWRVARVSRATCTARCSLLYIAVARGACLVCVLALNRIPYILTP